MLITTNQQSLHVYFMTACAHDHFRLVGQELGHWRREADNVRFAWMGEPSPQQKHKTNVGELPVMLANIVS